MNHYHSRRGFTLIELLVVIAIIGILSSIVLASLNTARNKGNDAAIKANMSTVSVQAELYYDSNSNSYGSFSSATCPTATSGNGMFSDTTIRQATAAVESANGSNNTTCVATGSAWAMSSPLLGGGTWCIDSLGQKKATTISGSACQ